MYQLPPIQAGNGMLLHYLREVCDIDDGEVLPNSSLGFLRTGTWKTEKMGKRDLKTLKVRRKLSLN